MNTLELNISELFKNKIFRDENLNLVVNIENQGIFFKFIKNENIIYKSTAELKDLRKILLLRNEEKYKKEIKINKLEILFYNPYIIKEKNLFLDLKLENLYIEKLILEKGLTHIKNNKQNKILSIKNKNSNINEIEIIKFKTEEFENLNFIAKSFHVSFNNCEVNLSDFNSVNKFPLLLNFLYSKIYGKLENKSLKNLKFIKSSIIYPFDLINNKINELKFMSRTKTSIPLYKDNDGYMKEILNFEKITNNNDIKSLTIENYIINKLFCKTDEKITLKNLEIKNLCNLDAKDVSLITCNIKNFVSNNFEKIVFCPRNNLKNIDRMTGEKIKIKLSSIYDLEELETIIHNNSKIIIKELIIEFLTFYQSTLNYLILTLLALDKLYKYMNLNTNIKIELLFYEIFQNQIYSSNTKIKKIMEIFEKDIKGANKKICLNNQKDILTIVTKFFNLFNGFKLEFPELENIKLKKKNNLIFNI